MISEGVGESARTIILEPDAAGDRLMGAVCQILFPKLDPRLWGREAVLGPYQMQSWLLDIYPDLSAHARMRALKLAEDYAEIFQTRLNAHACLA